jgi:hypothetical protein
MAAAAARLAALPASRVAKGAVDLEREAARGASSFWQPPPATSEGLSYARVRAERQLARDGDDPAAPAVYYPSNTMAAPPQPRPAPIPALDVYGRPADLADSDGDDGPAGHAAAAIARLSLSGAPEAPAAAAAAAATVASPPPAVPPAGPRLELLCGSAGTPIDRMPLSTRVNVAATATVVLANVGSTTLRVTWTVRFLHSARRRA